MQRRPGMPRSRASLVLAVLLCAACGGGTGGPATPGEFSLRLTGSQADSAVELTFGGTPTPLKRDQKGRGFPSALSTTLGAPANPEAPTVRVRGLHVGAGTQRLTLEATFPGPGARLLTGTADFEISSLALTGDPRAPLSWTGRLTRATLASKQGDALTGEGTLTVRPDCSVALASTGTACGVTPFLNLTRRTASLKRAQAPIAGECDADLGDAFVDGDQIAFDGSSLQSGRAQPLACRESPTSTALRRSLLCSGVATRSARGCDWNVLALGWPSQGGERAALVVVGSTPSPACAASPSCVLWFPEY